MKKLFLAITLLISLEVFSQTNEIKIELFTDSISKQFLIQYGQIEIKREVKKSKKVIYNSIQTIKLDSSLSFTVKKDDSFTNSFSVIFYMNEFLINSPFFIHYQDSISIYPFYIHFCNYERYKGENQQKKNCPKCNKQDCLLNIVYGLGGGHHDGEIPGGCIVPLCPNHWYCKRFKLEF